MPQTANQGAGGTKLALCPSDLQLRRDLRRRHRGPPRALPAPDIAAEALSRPTPHKPGSPEPSVGAPVYRHWRGWQSCRAAPPRHAASAAAAAPTGLAPFDLGGRRRALHRRRAGASRRPWRALMARRRRGAARLVAALGVVAAGLARRAGRAGAVDAPAASGGGFRRRRLAGREVDGDVANRLGARPEPAVGAGAAGFRTRTAIRARSTR